MHVAPRLVFVHGIGPHRVSETEVDTWCAALATGMRAAGHSKVADLLRPGSTRVTVRFANYSDLFLPNSANDGGADRGEAEAILTAVLADAIDQHLAEPQSDDVTALLHAARAQLDPVGDPQGAGNIAKHLLNACTTLLDIPPLRKTGRWLAAKLMVGDLSQVSRYLARGDADRDGVALDARIRARVLAQLTTDPTVVVSHSLGTVVAFEALHDHPGPVPLWVTLGSPLALRAVVTPHLRPRPPSTPATVARWLNGWDRDDLIAVRAELAGIAANTRGVAAESVRVDSDGLWVHPATTYLRTPGVAGPIAEALDAMTGHP
jgi:pimeloyl-ACP methyl ester carboxylesterase